jgi:hypothetical protein
MEKDAIPLGKRYEGRFVMESIFAMVPAKAIYGNLIMWTTLLGPFPPQGEGLKAVLRTRALRAADAISPALDGCVFAEAVCNREPVG